MSDSIGHLYQTLHSGGTFRGRYGNRRSSILAVRRIGYSAEDLRLVLLAAQTSVVCVPPPSARIAKGRRDQKMKNESLFIP
jgi:hypothetical protein